MSTLGTISQDCSSEGFLIIPMYFRCLLFTFTFITHTVIFLAYLSVRKNEGKKQAHTFSFFRRQYHKSLQNKFCEVFFSIWSGLNSSEQALVLSSSSVCCLENNWMQQHPNTLVRTFFLYVSITEKTIDFKDASASLCM